MKRIKKECKCHCHCKLHEGGKRFLHTRFDTVRSCEHCSPKPTKIKKIETQKVEDDNLYMTKLNGRTITMPVNEKELFIDKINEIINELNKLKLSH